MNRELYIPVNLFLPTGYQIYNKFFFFNNKFYDTVIGYLGNIPLAWHVFFFSLRLKDSGLFCKLENLLEKREGKSKTKMNAKVIHETRAKKRQILSPFQLLAVCYVPDSHFSQTTENCLPEMRNNDLNQIKYFSSR